MKFRLILLIAITLLAKTVNGQMLVAADEAFHDFFGYTFQGKEFTDFKINMDTLVEDTYLCIAKASNNIAYVGLLKSTATGERPMIIKYDFSDKSYVEIVSDDIERPVDIEIDKVNNKIYWIDRALDEMRRANLDGTEVEILGKIESDPSYWRPQFALDVEDDRIFFSFGRNTVAVTKISEWGAAQLSSHFDESSGRVGDIVVDDTGSYLYWCNNTEDASPHIVKRSLILGEGGKEEKIIENVDDRFLDLFLFDDRIYWTGNSTIVYSARLDGSDVRQELEGRFVGDFIIRNATSTATKHLENNISFSIKPNPVTDYLIVSPLVSESSTYTIVDASGMIIRKDVRIDNERIEVDALSHGSYFLIVRDEKGRTTARRFVK